MTQLQRSFYYIIISAFQSEGGEKKKVVLTKMKSLKKKINHPTKEPHTNVNRQKKGVTRKSKLERTIHTQNPLNLKLYKKGHPLQREPDDR